MAWECRSLKDLGQKDELINQLISDEGACRTAPATQGPLNIVAFAV